MRLNEIKKKSDKFYVIVSHQKDEDLIFWKSRFSRSGLPSQYGFDIIENTLLDDAYCKFSSITEATDLILTCTAYDAKMGEFKNKEEYEEFVSSIEIVCMEESTSMEQIGNGQKITKEDVTKKYKERYE